ncbi:MAG: hypothetical protein GY832_20120 [Chloroflexi bacterium]|nr:hypothetical protein [Chloroflexota bacterium]
MTKKKVLRKNASNENYARLARAVINSAREALGGTSKYRDMYAKACGFKDGEADALAFFASDWAEQLIDLSLGYEEPNTIIEKFLNRAYGRMTIREIPNARPAVTGPHIRKRASEAIKIGERDDLEAKLHFI